MPAEQSGLLAEAVKFTGELSCEPLAGEVTAMTGVVAKAVRPRFGTTETSARGSSKRGQFMKNLTTQRLAARK